MELDQELEQMVALEEEREALNLHHNLQLQVQEILRQSVHHKVIMEELHVEDQVKLEVEVVEPGQSEELHQLAMEEMVETVQQIQLMVHLLQEVAVVEVELVEQEELEEQVVVEMEEVVQHQEKMQQLILEVVVELVEEMLLLMVAMVAQV